MMKRSIQQVASGLVALAALGLFARAQAADDAPRRVTFYKDVLPILQAKCQDCHRPAGVNVGGMIAPMAFMSYEETRPWSKAIRRQVETGAMPPWFATAEFNGVFSNERILNEDEIATLVRWANTGGARGRPEEAPEPRTFVDTSEEGWSIGEPDLVIAIEPFYVEDDLEDLNISFTTVLTEEQLPEDVWIKAIEYKAGSQMVHHICNSAIAPGENPDLDFTERNGLGCIAPGSDLRTVPDEYGTFLPKGATIRWGMHYHKERGPGTGGWDQSQMAFVFTKKPVKHRVKFDIISSSNSWEVPPGHGNWVVGAARTFTEPTTILSYLPHMHFRGKAAVYTAFYPDGTQEVLLDVDAYDYNWQTIYRYAEPKLIPAGTRVEVKMWYDNTAEHSVASNFNPDRPVPFGLPTTDEMMNGWIGYANTIARDFDSEIARAEDRLEVEGPGSD